MSWFAGLASKAEDLLNRVDQSAASALHESTEPLSASIQRHFSSDRLRPNSPHESVANNRPYSVPPLSTTSPANQSYSHFSNRSISPLSMMNTSRSASAPLGRKADKDGALLDFLNSTEPVATDTKRERPKFTIGGHSRKSSASSTKSESIVDISMDDLDSDYNGTKLRSDDNKSPLIDGSFSSSINRQNSAVLDYTSDSTDSTVRHATFPIEPVSPTALSTNQQTVYAPPSDPHYHINNTTTTSATKANDLMSSSLMMMSDDFTSDLSELLDDDDDVTIADVGVAERSRTPINEKMPSVTMETTIAPHKSVMIESHRLLKSSAEKKLLEPVTPPSNQMLPSVQPLPMTIRMDHSGDDVTGSSSSERKAAVELDAQRQRISDQSKLDAQRQRLSDQSRLEAQRLADKSELEAQRLADLSEFEAQRLADQSELEAQRQKIVLFELENKLLKSEVTSMNAEIVTVVQREKSAQMEMRKLSEQQEELIQSERLIREYESRDLDFRESVKAKDHQIGVLRVRLEEQDTELAGKNQAMSLLEGERERLQRDHSDSSGVQSQVLENLKSKLTETESYLRLEQEAYRAIQRESMEKQSRQEDDMKSFTEQISLSHKKLHDEKSRSTDMSNQVKTEKLAADSAKQELIDYKEKAARILQSKDRLIASLKDGGATSGTADMTSSSAMTSELEEVKQERDLYKEELQIMSINLDRLRQEMSDLESQMQTDLDQSQDTIHSLQEQFESEKRKREECDHEILKQKQELRYASEEILQQRHNFQAQVSMKDAEIDRLSNQLSSKLNNNTNQAELENRLRCLTESLIQKQTSLEAISTEKTSLSLQLERLERRYRDNENVRTQAANSHIQMVDDSDVVRQRLPFFMKESTYDTHVTRGMKRAANTLDKFSIRLGVFLRRYPIARVFVIVYMLLLHLWVSVVLVTYEPEIHDHVIDLDSAGILPRPPHDHLKHA